MKRTKLTDKQRIATCVEMRTLGQNAYLRGEPIDTLSPLVSKWRADAWREGWNAAKKYFLTQESA